MEKRIDLIKKEDGCIEILVDGEKKHTIGNDKKISATDILNIFSFKRGDTFIITHTCKDHVGEEVVVYFEKLLKDISGKVSKEFPDQSDDSIN